jgi:hypothetical protein
MRDVSDKICRENKITFYIQSLFSENRAVYEILCKKYGRAGQATSGDTAHAL